MAESVFPVDIDTRQTVGDLNEEIKAENEDVQGLARKLPHFLAKKDDARVGNTIKTGCK